MSGKAILGTSEKNTVSYSIHISSIMPRKLDNTMPDNAVTGPSKVLLYFLSLLNHTNLVLSIHLNIYSSFIGTTNTEQNCILFGSDTDTKNTSTH